MGAGEDTDLTCQMADLVCRAPIATLVFVQNAGAEGFFLEVVEGLGNFKRGGGRKLLEDFGFHLVFEGFDCFVAIHLGGLVDGGFNTGTGHAVGDFEQFVFDEEKGSLTFLFSVGSGQLLLDFDEGLDRLLGKFEGGFEFGFGKFFGTAFDHERFVFGADVDEVEVALGIFVMGGVGDEFPGDATDPDGGDGSGPRDVGDHEGSGGAIESEDIGVVLAVGAEENGDDLGIVVVAFGEEGTQGPIDHAAGEDLLFGRATFAAEVAAGDTANGGGFFFIFDSQGEEVLAVFHFGGGDSGDDNDRFAHGDEGGAVGQFGEFAGFDVDIAIAQAGGEGFMVCVHRIGWVTGEHGPERGETGGG